MITILYDPLKIPAKEKHINTKYANVQNINNNSLRYKIYTKREVLELCFAMFSRLTINGRGCLWKYYFTLLVLMALKNLIELSSSR